jgi:hypothetical protein
MSQTVLSDPAFNGTWRCRYWYPSNKHDGEDVSEYRATIHQTGNELVLESSPNEEKSYMLARLVLDGDVVTGTWQENTSPHGEFAGLVYSGAVQLLVSEAKDHMDGKWVGIGQEDGKKQIYTGRWEIIRQ